MADGFLHGPPHVARYLETDGEDGYHWRNGTTTLLLFTKGRRSGEERVNALIYREDGDRYVIVASRGGTPEHPSWYVNLRAHPDDVEVQVKADRFRARAHDAEGAERERLWELMTEAWPDYDAYQRRTDRRIPVVVLERA